ncbi:hypothetical protein TEA_000790 [Camellia sinensis var. sinensis]|uniref:CASP-like protein n=1 Tax=Camellia sinensis var. sinensis TaxID=542762 RepID=A0A4S4EB58_CAMSN|nr:hypothetical protein TEA_000790 [Camellia sinensis var. sinensis]
MDEVPGSVGTSAGFALRLGQTVFSSASLLFMSLGVEFYSYTAFCFLVTIMGLVIPWSFTLALVDGYSVLVKCPPRQPGILLTVVVGDWLEVVVEMAVRGGYWLLEMVARVGGWGWFLAVGSQRFLSMGGNGRKWWPEVVASNGAGGVILSHAGCRLLNDKRGGYSTEGEQQVILPSKVVHQISGSCSHGISVMVSFGSFLSFQSLATSFLVMMDDPVHCASLLSLQNSV